MNSNCDKFLWLVLLCVGSLGAQVPSIFSLHTQNDAPGTGLFWNPNWTTSLWYNEKRKADSSPLYSSVDLPSHYYLTLEEVGKKFPFLMISHCICSGGSRGGAQFCNISYPLPSPPFCKFPSLLFTPPASHLEERLDPPMFCENKISKPSKWATSVVFPITESGKSCRIVWVLPLYRFPNLV